jgi:CRISPR-associated protein (TIGR03986 family)
MSFTNPYNFVSLNDSCEKKERPIPMSRAYDGEELFTGEFVCFLTTKTKLFIPNTTNDHVFPAKEKEILDEYNTNPHKRVSDTPDNRSKSYDFFGYTDLDPKKGAKPTERPIIPGSSIRGVIRSVYETITRSCMSTSGGRETPLYRRSTAPRTNFGIIRDGHLYEAKKLLVKASHRRYCGAYKDKSEPVTNGKTGDAFKIDKGSDEYIVVRKERGGEKEIHTKLYFARNIGKGKLTGYYLRGEEFGKSKKHFDAIMVEKDDQPPGMPYALTPRDEERLKTVIELYAHGKDGVNQTAEHNEYKGFLQARIKPVYYTKIGATYYIAPAAITKEVFDRSVRGILKAMGGFDACSDEKKLCEACHLFGMVGTGQDADARSARVQFRDAVPADENGGYMGDVVAMPILGSPKITATEFYMEQPAVDDDVFNYDYAQKYNVNTDKIEYRSLTDSEVRLRGRKFYWHHGTPPRKNARLDAPKLFQIVRPVLSGKRFRFIVAFERLTIDELNKLRYALELDADHAHKMGHGKPAGYGGVQISVDRDESRIYTVNEDFEIVSGTLPGGAFTYTSQDADFLALTNIVSPKPNIRYPVGTAAKNKEQPEATVFDWFVLNREANGGNSTSHPKFAYVLPKANAEDVTLPEIKKELVSAPNGRKKITQGKGSNRRAVWDWYHG